MLMGITINREGQFSVRHTHSSENQCGLKGTQVLTYKVKIIGDSDHLGNNGFLIDNDEIHNYFIVKYQKVREFQSCELIAVRACEALMKLCEGHGAKVHAIDVTISGNPLAGLTASWRAPRKVS
jgi:hypothetical protein